MKDIAGNKELQRLKEKLFEKDREFDELKEEVKLVLRKMLYMKNLKGSCDCVK